MKLIEGGVSGEPMLYDTQGTRAILVVLLEAVTTQPICEVKVCSRGIVAFEVGLDLHTDSLTE